MAQVRSETLVKLTCCRCQKYLSHFPIHFDTTAGSICGRCVSPENAVRNHLYEQAMEYSKFPCCFESSGCIERLVARDIPKHEKWCKYRMFQCPALEVSNCAWQGLVKDLYYHFEKKHMIFILPNKSFEIDFMNSHKENCLINHGQDLYILNRTSNSKKNTYSCTINYAGSNPRCSDFFFKLNFKNINGSKQHDLKAKIGETIEVKGEEINRILGDPMSIVVEVDIFEEDEVEKMDEGENEYSSAINLEMLKELECLVSKDYYK